MNQISIINPKNLGEINAIKSFNNLNELSDYIRNSPWAPGIFNGRRAISDLHRIGLLVLDVDAGETLGSAVERFKDFKHIIATSRNHQKEKNGVVCDRFRVVLFLDSEITNDKDFKATWETAYKRWQFIDKACKDSSRFFYPSPEIISINESGRHYPVSVAPSGGLRDATMDSRGPESGTNEYRSLVKGDLWKSTLDLLTFGAPAGQRHTRLIQAVGNMREQGYSQPEVIELLEDMTTKSTADWTQTGLNQADLKTIDRMFNRETKYPFTPKQAPEENEKGFFVNASELLSETFDYLSNKDKVSGEPTGIDGLDALLGGGFRTGELTVLMAQAKTGKNTLYHYLIHKYLERGIPFGYASRELNPATEVIPNLMSIALQQNAWKSQVDTHLRERTYALVNNWQLYFAPGYGHFEPTAIDNWMRSLKDLGVNNFLFDHFHYALLTEDYESTSSLIKRLKTLTKDLDVHLSLIVQPRSLRENEQLSLATLRGGAAIGQALDNLLILERVKGEQNVSRLRLDQARHKLAKLGEIYLKYDNETTSFDEVEKTTIVENDTHMPQVLRGTGRPWPRV